MTCWGVEPKGIEVIHPFSYEGVTLDDGRLKEQFDEVRDYYVRIPNDDYLRGFRERATGRPAPGVELGGWYSADFGNCFGQVISGLSRMYASTRDEAIRQKIDALVSGWGECVEADGYFFYSKKPGPRLYMFDKTVCGLLDAYLYCQNEDALAYLSRITDWSLSNLSKEKEYANANADMSRPGGDVSEWYTASENLYRAYLVTGERKYYDAAEFWEYTEFWDLFARKADIFGARPNGLVTHGYHAYSHVNSLSSAAAAYLVRGSRHYLDALVNAYDYLLERQCYATGGYGPNEGLRETLLVDCEAHFETQCGSWAAFKLAKYLICFTGDARYGDWVELLACNGIGASIPMNARGGVMYYSNYNPEGASKANSEGWECCAGSRPQVVADYCDQVYYKDADSLYVVLFTSSSVQWAVGGSAVTVCQRTRFPESSRVDFSVSVSRPTRFALKVRVPGWLAGPVAAEVNGSAVEVETTDLHWAVFDREWHDGDRLSLQLPMKLRASRLSRDADYPAAVMYGPVAMAVQAKGNPSGSIDLADPEAAFTPSPDEPLTWRLVSDPDILLRPFYAYGEGEPYFLYLDPNRLAWIRPKDIAFTGEWNWDGRASRWCGQAGATAECAFEGTGIRWLGFGVKDAGMAEVIIDGKSMGVVDQYGPGHYGRFDCEYRGLKPGKHTITIRVLAEKNPQSLGTNVNVVGFDIIP